MVNEISFAINNGRCMNIRQNTFDGDVIIETEEEGKTGKVDRRDIISSGDFVMLMNLYRYVKDNDIKNAFINPYGENDN